MASAGWGCSPAPGPAREGAELDALAFASLAALVGAWWTALVAFRRRRRQPEALLRFAAGLVLGALAAHLGWALLHAGHVASHPRLLLDPGRGYCVLFVPLGPLASAALGLDREARAAWLAAAFGSLPLALAVARAGCLAAGCCRGVPASSPWLPWAVHPTPVYDILGLVALHACCTRAGARWLPSVFLAGFGTLRLALEPLRAAPPLGPPALPVWIVAVLWIAVGLALRPRRARSLTPLQSRQERS